MSESTNPGPRVWLVTGCSSGLGRALVEEVVAAGDRVVATARQPSALDDLASRVPDQVRVLPLDVTDGPAVAGIAAEALGEWGRVDVVVNNAGEGLLGAVEEVSEEQVRRSFEVNFFGPWRVTRAFLPHLRERRSGHVVMISAAAAIANYPGFGAYGAAKRALEGLAESLAQEVRPFGVRVTVVQPGPFRTGFARRSVAVPVPPVPGYEATVGKFRQLLERMDGRQPGDPARAAQAILQAVRHPNPPFRLVLGRYAVGKVRKALADAGKELADWETVAAGTDFS